MPYPRQVTLSEKKQERLVSYITDELSNHYMERGQWIQDLLDWQRDYWAKPSEERKTFPFVGASNIIIPLSAIAIEAVHARAWMTLFATKPFVSIKARPGPLVEVEHAFENWLDYFLIDHLKVENQLDSSIMEIAKFGTGCGKSGYERVLKRAVRPIGDGDQEEDFVVITKDGPTADAVPIANFLMPFYAIDPQTAPWVGEEHTSSMFEVESMERSGMFLSGTAEKIRPSSGAEGTTQNEFQKKQEELEKKEPTLPARVTWQEIWVGFDVDAEEDETERDPAELQVLWHHDTRTIMSIRYNYHSDLRRPYRLGVYYPVEHRWAGIGICKQNEQFQRIVTTQNRQRLDNATLANMRMFVVHKLSGFGPKEPIFPGKMWFVDDMTHIQDLQLREVYPSSFANEQSVVLYSQQRSGVSEVTLGLPQIGTPGTATGDLARIQEGKQKFDFVFRNMKSFISELIRDVILNVSQFGTRTARYFDMVEGSDRVRDIIFNPDITLLRDGILFEVSAAGQNRNRTLDRANWQQIAVILQQYFTGMAQLAAGLGNPNLVALVNKKGMLAITEALRQILESYDVRNIDRIVVSEVEEMLRNGASQPGTRQLPPPGGAGGPQGNGQTSRVADLLEALSQAGGNR